MNKNEFNLKIVMLLTIGFVIFSSCKKEEEQQQNPPEEINYTGGMYIINEGPFQTGTGTIDFLSNEGVRTEKIFQTENNAQQIGNVVQSAKNMGTLTYIVVNNSNKIEMVTTKTFASVGNIQSITSPRYIEQADEITAYVSCWDNTVKIFKLDGTEVLGSVNVGTGPEKLMKVNDEIWVLNQGGFSIDSTISIINIADQSVTQTLQLYPKPTGIQMDKNGRVWVLCSGKGWNGFPGADDSEGHLICIDTSNYSILKDFTFPTTSEHPEKLIINETGDELFYNYPGGIFKFEIDAISLEGDPFIARSNMFYGLGYNPETNAIFGSDPLDFSQNGWVFWYDAVSGAAIDSTESGIIPGEFYYVDEIVE
jgi:hypothetical protein